MNNEWEKFLERRAWAVGVDQDCKFFLYDVNEDCQFDDEHLFWGHTPITAGWDCEADIAEKYGFTLS